MACKVRDCGGKFAKLTAPSVRVTGKPTGADVKKLTEQRVAEIGRKPE